MPFVENDGVRIHYKVERPGEPLVIQHGFTSSIEAVRLLGYSDSLKDSYQVILIDARGHGVSDKPQTPESYGLQTAVSDVLAVQNELGIPKAPFFDYSMDGVIGFAMANFAPDRLLSLIVGAAHPFEDNLESFQNIDGKDPDAFVKALEAFLGEKRAPEILPLLLTNDLEAFAAAARPRPNMEDMLPRLNIPCLLFSFSMVIQDIVAMGFGSKLHYLQPICIAELIFVPEISIRNLDKIASVCTRFPTIHARLLFGVKIVDC